MNKYIKMLQDGKDPHSVVLELLSHPIPAVDDNHYTVRDYVETEQKYCNQNLVDRILETEIKELSCTIKEYLKSRDFKY